MNGNRCVWKLVCLTSVAYGLGLDIGRSAQGLDEVIVTVRRPASESQTGHRGGGEDSRGAGWLVPLALNSDKLKGALDASRSRLP